MNIGILGSGSVAQTLASGFLKKGHQVMLGTRDSAKLKEFALQHSEVKVGNFNDAAVFGEVLVLAVKGTAALDCLNLIKSEALKGKILIDTTNPIADAPPSMEYPLSLQRFPTLYWNVSNTHILKCAA